MSNMNPSQVRRISTTTIHPTNPTHSAQTVDLTPWDLATLVLHPIQKGLLFRQPTQPNWLANLKASLSLALNNFFPLAGRLATRTHPEDDTISVFIRCDNSGAEFVHAAADVTVSEIITPLYVPHIVNDFFPLNLTINYDGRSRPLMAVQVTELADGVFVGLTANHVAVDGTSFWHFMNSWAEICRTGSDEISLPPNFTRLFLPNLPVRFPASVIDKSLRPYSPPPLQERVFHFAPQNVAKLKQKASLELNNNAVSSLQAVLAHMWRGVVRAKNLKADVEVNYRLPMGIRGRTEPPLPKGYFGNSFKTRLATTTSDELMARGFGFAAGILNKAVGEHTSANIWRDWEKWVKEPRFTSFDDWGTTVLLSGSSQRFNIYGNDFGWGCPIAVRSGCSSKFNGKLTVFPGATTGSIEIEACLSEELLKRMGEDSEFMQAVGTLEDNAASYVGSQWDK